MIKTKNLEKYYYKGSKNELHVVNNTSLELPSQGLITFLGHSGSGKTTLLNVLGGLDSANGTIEYDDLKINNYNMHKVDIYRLENISYVFQNYNLLQDETVYDNLRLALEVFGITDKEEVDKRIEYALKAIGMYKFRKKKAYALSGGQQQRVSIARALVKKCKIIIADEPTGNLDSENTVEVMNVLKKISKTSLVLLVTHNKEIADFYSDEIYELKDGCIINKYTPNDIEKLNVSFDNTIYLKDLEYKEEESTLGKIKVYYDSNEKVDLSIIIKNGNVYIESNSNIKLTKDSNLKIYNEHYKDQTKEELDLTFDNSWYSNDKKIGFFKETINNIKYGFLKFKNAKKMMKFLYFSLGLIGFLLATSFIVYTNSVTVDESEFFYNKNFNTLVNENFEYEEARTIRTLYENGDVDTVFEPKEVTLVYEKQITYQQKSSFQQDMKLAPLYPNLIELYLGAYPSDDNEILIPYHIAEELIDISLGTMNHSDLIGNRLTVRSKEYTAEFKISGITKNDQGYLYTLENRFLTFSYGRNDLLNTSTYRYAKYEVSQDGNKLYTVMYGRDVNLESKRLEVLCDFSKVDIGRLRYDENNDCYDIITYRYKETSNSITKEYKLYVVGYYLPNKYQVENTQYITNQLLPTAWYNNKSNNICSLGNDQYEIIEGRDIQNDDEVVVPYLYGAPIGSMIDKKTVVGIYTGTTLAMSYICIGTSNAIFLEHYNNEIVFLAEDVDKINDYFEQSNAGITCVDIYTHQYNLQRVDESKSLIIFTIVFIVLLTTSLVFMYFVMRSKMISNVYNIGIYRAIGATRWTLVKRFLAETIILALFTCFVGYVIATICIGLSINLINNIFSVNFLTIDWLFVGLGSIVMFIAIIFFGILPILLLLRKTPTMICAKYDI